MQPGGCAVKAARHLQENEARSAKHAVARPDDGKGDKSLQPVHRKHRLTD
jgi:hypothetical protein